MATKRKHLTEGEPALAGEATLGNGAPQDQDIDAAGPAGEMSEGRVERRLAAILAADVVGHSRLMGADEEDTLAALRAVRRELSDPKIKEQQGRIVKTMGDGLLMEFASVVGAASADRGSSACFWSTARQR
jgi:class 3 adenylate cyclase